MVVSELSPETRKKIADLSPLWLGVGNPADIWPAMMPSEHPVDGVLRKSMVSFLADHQVDAVLFIGGAFTKPFSLALSQLLQEMSDTFKDKPLVCHIYGDYAGEAGERLEKSGGIAVFPTPDRAVRALARLAEYSEFCSREIS